MISLLADHIAQLDRWPPPGVISWACPVPYFGDARVATIATVGINPSNREFADITGSELDGAQRRLPTLASLGLGRWADADSRHMRVVVAACDSYFRGRPYDRWFGVLERILGPSGYSFYGSSPSACHIDLVPFATHHKWGELPSVDRLRLLDVNCEPLALLVRSSAVRTLVLNGRSVVDAFQSSFDVKLDPFPMPTWDLSRTAGDDVKGYHYLRSVTELAGVPLDREVLIAGFNHNVQSSFGVTGNVLKAIGIWLAELTRIHA